MCAKFFYVYDAVGSLFLMIIQDGKIWMQTINRGRKAALELDRGNICIIFL